MTIYARLLFAALGLLAGCRSRAPSSPPAVCALTLPAHLRHTSPETLPRSVWYELLFKGYREGIAQDAVDCSGEPIAWSPLAATCVEGEAEVRELARQQKLPDELLVIRHAGGDYWFGWAPFVVLDNGMSEGPLAIARNHDGKLEVRAIGNLRAFPGRARLEVRKLGRDHILVAEGESCGARGTCARGTRLMWLDRQHFRVRPLRSASVRSCLGPAWFPHSEVIETALGPRWRRALQHDVALAYEDERILVDEHITVNDRDLEQSSLPARLFREAQSQVRITLEDGEFMSEGQSLWSAIRTEDGATDARAAGSRFP